MRRWLTFASTIGIIALVSLAQSSGEPVVARKVAANLDTWCPVIVDRVIDADTLVGTVVLPWGVQLTEQHLRVDTHDCWEASKRRQSESAGEITDAEVAKGKKAAAELVKLLEGSDVQLYAKPGIRARDNYGRLLGPWRLVTGMKVEDMQTIAARKNWIRK